MKALTIQQPYASLIANGAKWVENRMWSTWYRGPLAIHAGKASRYLSARELTRYPTGVVVAVCQLVECLSLRPTGMRRRLQVAGIEIEDFLGHEHTEGPWCWILKDVGKLATPVPAVGKQGLWEWEAAKQCTGHRDDFDPPVH